VSIAAGTRVIAIVYLLAERELSLRVESGFLGVLQWNFLAILEVKLHFDTSLNSPPYNKWGQRLWTGRHRVSHPKIVMSLWILWEETPKPEADPSTW